jgi:hypothetical protein
MPFPFPEIPSFGFPGRPEASGPAVEDPRPYEVQHEPLSEFDCGRGPRFTPSWVVAGPAVPLPITSIARRPVESLDDKAAA